MPSEAALSVTDERTGKHYRLPLADGAVRAMDLRQIRTSPEDFGLLAYDPGCTNTATCRSAITFIDGERGILDYRGYPIEQLAEQAGYLEVAWLLLQGELPAPEELEAFRAAIAAESKLPDWVGALFEALPPTAHPMSMLQAGLAALGAAFPDAQDVGNPEVRRRQIHRLLALAPALAAGAYRRRCGRPLVEPDPSLSYAGDFLRMLLGEPGVPYAPQPALERALEVLLILHQDHEQNCSTTAVRSVASSRAVPFAAVAAGTGALYGPLHGGANQAVLEMLAQIGDPAEVGAFVASCKDGRRRLMGFGHRVYKSYDPRARIIKRMADKVFQVTGPSPKLRIAQELERIALSDDYFVSRKLYPNVDFYSGLIYDALGFEAAMFPVFFAVGRMAGWLAHWDELLADPEFRIVRPRQIYTGPPRREFRPASGGARPG